MPSRALAAVLQGALMGPPAPPTLEARQMIGRQDEAQSAPLSDLLPQLISQVLDAVSTEKALHVPKEETLGGPTSQGNTEQMNILPGARTPGGVGSASRIGWGLAETLLAHLLTKDWPKARKTVLTSLPAMHSSLALHNFALSQNDDVAAMMERKR